MRTSFKIFVAFGLLMGLLGFGLMFLDNSATNDNAHKPKSSYRTAAQVETEAYQEQMAKFQQQFPTLKKTIPNLRWFDDHVYGEGADSVEIVDLVTPFGPCISMTAGHGLYGLEFGEDFFDLKRPHKLLGNFSNRADAVQTAEQYCHKWYLTESNNSASLARTRPLWFTPDPEAPLLPASTGESRGSSTEPSDQSAPIERADPSQVPAPVEHGQPPQN